MGVGAITLICMLSISKRLITAELKVSVRFQRYAYHEELFEPLAPSTVQIILSLYRVMIMSWMCIYVWILESIFHSSDSFIQHSYMHTHEHECTGSNGSTTGRCLRIATSLLVAVRLTGTQTRHTHTSYICVFTYELHLSRIHS